MAIAKPAETGLALLKALGIEDRHVISLTVRLHANDYPLVTVEKYLSEDGAETLARVVKNYKLVPHDTGEATGG